MKEVEDKYIVFFTRNGNVLDNYMGKRVVVVDDLQNFKETLVADSNGFAIDSNFIDSSDALDIEMELMSLIKEKDDVTLVGFVGPKVFQQSNVTSSQLLLNVSTGNCCYFDPEYPIPPDMVKVVGPEIITSELEKVSATLYFHNLCEGTETDVYLLTYEMKFDDESGYLISAKSIVGDFKKVSYQLLKLNQELPIDSEVSLSLATNVVMGEDGLPEFQENRKLSLVTSNNSEEVQTTTTVGSKSISIDFRDKD